LTFLHLLDNYHYREGPIVPKSLTQKGIQNKVNCDLSVISRILKKNEEKGYIYPVLMKIENVKRKQNAYFLSDEGLKIAENLRKKISDWD